MFAKRFINDIRAAADIIEIVGEIVELKSHGDRHKGLCPFHAESSPSFSVSNGLYHCFGCGEGGDVIRFVQRQQGIIFGDAVRYLSDRYGLVDDDLAPVRRRPTPPKKRPLPRNWLPEGYNPQRSAHGASYDDYEADGLFEDWWRTPDDLLLLCGIVPTHLIIEIKNDLSNL